MSDEQKGRLIFNGMVVTPQPPLGVWGHIDPATATWTEEEQAEEA